MLFLVSLDLLESKGNWPAIMAYKVTPRHQTSIISDLYLSFFAIYGEVYDGEPQKVVEKHPSYSLVTKPKSTSFAFQLESNIMFSHLISL
jgi:hypothetical protein